MISVHVEGRVARGLSEVVATLEEHFSQVVERDIANMKSANNGSLASNDAVQPKQGSKRRNIGLDLIEDFGRSCCTEVVHRNNRMTGERYAGDHPLVIIITTTKQIVYVFHEGLASIISFYMCNLCSFTFID